VDGINGSERYGYNHKNLRVWTRAADGKESFSFYHGTRNLATYTLATDASGNLSFRVVKTNIYFGKRLAQSGGDVVVADRLGSTRAWSAKKDAKKGTKTGAKTASYTPFGEKVQGRDDDDSKFDGYVEDVATGLKYAEQRYYSSTLGRFMSPDPYEKSAHLANPNSWNRYAFVSNDPINRTDPHGLNDGNSAYNSISWDMTSRHSFSNGNMPSNSGWKNSNWNTPGNGGAGGNNGSGGPGAPPCTDGDGGTGGGSGGSGQMETENAILDTLIPEIPLETMDLEAVSDGTNFANFQGTNFTATLPLYDTTGTIIGTQTMAMDFATDGSGTQTITGSVPQDNGTTLTTVIVDYMGEGGVLEDQTIESSDGKIALDSQFSFNLDTFQGTVTTENFNTQMETITVLQYPVTNPPGITSMTLQQQLNALAPTVISSSVKNGLN
jgi:RHS repeat-associated protein